MANTIRGKILAIEKIQEIAPKNGNQKPFLTRRVLLDATRFDGLTGERGQDNFIMFEFSGDNDVHVPDNFNQGDLVEVSFRLRGVKYVKQGETKPQYFVHIAGYKIEKLSFKGQDAPQAQPQSQQAPQNGGQQAQGQTFGTDTDDLPFD